MVDKDDGVRPGVTPQALGGLKAVFKKNGTTTAGNSSQVRAFSLMLPRQMMALPMSGHHGPAAQRACPAQHRQRGCAGRGPPVSVWPLAVTPLGCSREALW